MTQSPSSVQYSSLVVPIRSQRCRLARSKATTSWVGRVLRVASAPFRLGPRLGYVGSVPQGCRVLRLRRREVRGGLFVEDALTVASDQRGASDNRGGERVRAVGGCPPDTPGSSNGLPPVPTGLVG